MSHASEPVWPARPALFLDLDGTVLEFADTPDAVAVSRELEPVLEHIERSTDGAVAVISGRSIDALDRLLAPHLFAAAGIHGLERRDATGRLTRAGGFGDKLADARRLLDTIAERYPGTFVEDKALTVAFHFRRRPEFAAELAGLFAELARDLDAELELLSGHFVYEIKPRIADKGRAIRAFMEEPPFAGRTPVFVGDDVTDESGFGVVNALGGLSVKVGDGPTRAVARLPDVPAVIAWLAALTAERGIEQRRESV